MLRRSEAISQLNKLGSLKTPFTFYCDFLGEQWIIDPEPSQAKNFELQLIHESNTLRKPIRKKVSIKKNPISFFEYETIFRKIVDEINLGNSFLTNLTFKTPIETNLSLKDIFQYSHAKYKLLTDSFVVFSPETFIQISEGHIFSYPMKGTIDAFLPHAKDTLLNDPKEIAEHVTIVDLIRNDLSQVASHVEVISFRYIDEIQTNHQTLLQVSSKIKGKLTENWQSNIGTILSQLLPAGSISGAPKPQTIEIIHKAETHHRGFYTGICGKFDGNSLDTGVMIRFIEKENNQLYYYSGGGITSFSDPQKEYQEMQNKIYLPIKW